MWPLRGTSNSRQGCLCPHSVTSRIVLFCATHHDLQRIIWQRSLQCLGFILWCAHPHIGLSLTVVQDDRHRPGGTARPLRSEKSSGNRKHCARWDRFRLGTTVALGFPAKQVRGRSSCRGSNVRTLFEGNDGGLRWQKGATCPDLARLNRGS